MRTLEGGTRLLVSNQCPNSTPSKAATASSDAYHDVSKMVLRLTFLSSLRKDRKDPGIHASHVLGMAEGVTNEQVKTAYNEQMLRWASYERYRDSIKIIVRTRAP